MRPAKHYNYFRDYDSATGKYVQSDSIGLLGGLNTFLYAGARPSDAVDPTGEVIWFVPLLLKAAGGAAVEIGLQMIKNYGLGCDLFDSDNYDWVDVGISAGVSAFAPGLGKTGKTMRDGSKAAAELERQRQRAQTLNRIRKLERRIERNHDEVAAAVLTQWGFQSAKAVGKGLTPQTQGHCECKN